MNSIKFNKTLCVLLFFGSFSAFSQILYVEAAFSNAFFKDYTSSNGISELDNSYSKPIELGIGLGVLFNASKNSRMKLDLGINYNGILYKNLTGVNTDVVPLSDSVNWEDASDKIKAMGKVNANGTVSKVLFNASANRLSAGVYEITFATPMIDAHYIIQLTMKYNSGAGNGTMDITYYDQTTTSFKVDVINSVADFQFMFTVLGY